MANDERKLKIADNVFAASKLDADGNIDPYYKQVITDAGNTKLSDNDFYKKHDKWLKKNASEYATWRPAFDKTNDERITEAFNGEWDVPDPYIRDVRASKLNDIPLDEVKSTIARKASEESKVADWKADKDAKATRASDMEDYSSYKKAWNGETWQEYPLPIRLLLTTAMKATPQTAMNEYINGGSDLAVGAHAGIGTIANLLELYPGTSVAGKLTGVAAGPLIRMAQEVAQGKPVREAATTAMQDIAANGAATYIPVKQVYDVAKGGIQSVLGKGGSELEKASSKSIGRLIDKLDAAENAKARIANKQKRAKEILNELQYSQRPNGASLDQVLQDYAERSSPAEVEMLVRDIAAEYPDVAARLKELGRSTNISGQWNDLGDDAGLFQLLSDAIDPTTLERKSGISGNNWNINWLASRANASKEPIDMMMDAAVDAYMANKIPKNLERGIRGVRGAVRTALLGPEAVQLDDPSNYEGIKTRADYEKYIKKHPEEATIDFPLLKKILTQQPQQRKENE